MTATSYKEIVQCHGCSIDYDYEMLVPSQYCLGFLMLTKRMNSISASLTCIMMYREENFRFIMFTWENHVKAYPWIQQCIYFFSPKLFLSLKVFNAHSLYILYHKFWLSGNGYETLYELM